MKTFMIYPDKARALGNVMNNNSNIEDMTGVLCDPTMLHDNGGNPLTVEYEGAPFPIFQIGVLGDVYSAFLSLEVSDNPIYAEENMVITATLRDIGDELIDGKIAVFCGVDCITNGINTGSDVVYANTTNGVLSFNYSFDDIGEFVLNAVSLGTNTHHRTQATSEVILVTKKEIILNIDGLNISDIFSTTDDISFTVQLLEGNSPIAGLIYDILLDGELFDSGTSTNNGEEYTISNLEAGTHTIKVSYDGNNIFNKGITSREIYVVNYVELEGSMSLSSTEAHRGDTVTATAIVLDEDENPVEGVTVVLYSYLNENGLEPTPVGSHITNSEGIVNFTLDTSNYGVMYYDMQIESTNWHSSASIGNSLGELFELTVEDRIIPNLILTAPTKVIDGDTVVLTATLTDGGVPLQNKTIQFAKYENNLHPNSYETESATTDSNGVATIQIIADIHSRHVYSCSFTGGTEYAETSSNQVTFTINEEIFKPSITSINEITAYSDWGNNQTFSSVPTVSNGVLTIGFGEGHSACILKDGWSNSSDWIFECDMMQNKWDSGFELMLGIAEHYMDYTPYRLLRISSSGDRACGIAGRTGTNNSWRYNEWARPFFSNNVWVHVTIIKKDGLYTVKLDENIICSNKTWSDSSNYNTITVGGACWGDSSGSSNPSGVKIKNIVVTTNY